MRSDVDWHHPPAPKTYEEWNRAMYVFFSQLGGATKRKVNWQRLQIIEERFGVNGLLDVVLDYRTASQAVPVTIYRFFEKQMGLCGPNKKAPMAERTGHGRETKWTFTSAGWEALSDRYDARKRGAPRTQRKSYVGDGGMIFLEPERPKIKMRRDDAEWNI